MKITIPLEFMCETFELDLMVERLTIDEVFEVETVEILDVRYYIGTDEKELDSSLAHIVGTFASKFLNHTWISDRTNEEIAKIIAEET